MNIDNFLYSGFSFTDNEDLLKFKFKMLNLVLSIAVFFAPLFALLSDIGISYIGDMHAKVDYLYGFLSLCLILYLRQNKDNYKMVVKLFLAISMLTFISALILVIQDEFRIIWFYIFIFLSFILLNKQDATKYAIFTIVIIIVINYFFDLKISSVAINSAVLGLVIVTLLSRVYTNKVSDYENAIYTRNKELEHLATTDGLTGIMNRRYFDEVSNKYFETAQRYSNNISLLILDLDNFKTINDNYGHCVGDDVLISFVEKIKPSVRKSDIFARIGGEEFSILLFNTNAKDAQVFAQKICDITKEIEVETSDGIVSVTSSIGVSQNRDTDTSFNDIYLRSDKALYQAKDEGRDRVYVL